jgi:hypothetical protein
MFVPVNGLRRQLFGMASLDGITPTCRPCQHILPTSSPPSHTGFRCFHVPIPAFSRWWVGAHGPGIGSLPWRLRKAA